MADGANPQCESVKRALCALLNSVGNLCAMVGDEQGRAFVGMGWQFVTGLPAPFVVQTIGAVKPFFKDGFSRPAIEAALRGQHVDASRRPAHEAILAYPDLDNLLKRATVLLDTAEKVSTSLPPNPFIANMINMCLQLGNSQPGSSPDLAPLMAMLLQNNPAVAQLQGLLPPPPPPPSNS